MIIKESLSPEHFMPPPLSSVVGPGRRERERESQGSETDGGQREGREQLSPTTHSRAH
jgi:hypothetical protein